MAGLQIVTWDGGGNLPPALGIAGELRRRGHAVRVIGEESQGSALASAGLSFTAWSHPLSTGQAERSAADRLTHLIREVWLNTDLADEVIAILARQPADLAAQAHAALDHLRQTGPQPGTHTKVGQTR